MRVAGADRSIPTLSGGTLLGHVRELRADRLGLIRRMDAECAGMLRISLFGRSAYFVNAPELLHEILIDKSKCFNKSSLIRYMLYPLAGEGLFTSSGELWRRQRRLMAPIFQQRDIVRFADDMVECTLRGIHEWRAGECLDISRELTRITMSIVGRALFEAETFGEADALGAALSVALSWGSSNAGTPLPAIQALARKALERCSAGLPATLAEPTRAFAGRLHGPVLFVSPHARRLKQAIQVLDERVARMIEERRAAGLSRQDLLTRLLVARDEEDGARMDDRQVRDEVLTLFVAGHETTANALAWSMDLLVRHPHVYAQVQAEVDALGRAPRHEDLPRLAGVLRVFKEALRLYPPAYIFSREANTDVEIGGHHFPRGSIMFMSPYAIHRRAELWPDPDRFDPERFRAEGEASRPRMAFLPFGIGPRVCIGNHFALMEGQLVLATLLQHASFEAVSAAPSVPEPSLTLRPRGGIPLRVQLRSPAWAKPSSPAVALLNGMH
jgi:cytochrome P450